MEINTKKCDALEVGDIIVAHDVIMRVESIHGGSYSTTASVSFFGKRQFLRKLGQVRFYLADDDDIPYAASVADAKKVLAELNKPEPYLPFFVYGTLRKGMGNYEGFLIGMTKAEMPASAEGLIFHGGSMIPYMSHGDGVVQGELIYVKDEKFGAVLEQLDRLEGYRKGGTWNHYDREVTTVTLEDGSQLEAYAYYYKGGTAFMEPITSGDYKAWRLDGREDEYYSKRRRRR